MKNAGYKFHEIDEMDIYAFLEVLEQSSKPERKNLEELFF
jgi:hypothetical protein